MLSVQPMINFKYLLDMGQGSMGVSPWTEIWNGTVEWKMEWSTYNYS